MAYRKETRERYMAEYRDITAGKKAAKVQNVSFRFHDPKNYEIAERLMAEIPEDRRGLTARIAGDPIFERSALFRKMQEGKA